MRPHRHLAIALVVGLVAFVAPIWISVQLAWNESVASEKEMGLRYAADVMRRAEETAHQFGNAVRRLDQDGLGRCSPQEIDLMRQIDVASSHLQMIARISGNTLECTSLGTVQPMDVGKPTLVTENGVEERIGIDLGGKPSARQDLLNLKGVAVLVDTDLVIDIETEGKDVGLALLVPSSQRHLRLIESGSSFRSEWFKPAARGSAISFMDDGYIVSQVRSRTMDIAAVSVMPRYEAYKRVKHFAMLFVPIGLLCGCGLSWAVIHISRARSSLPALLRAAVRRREFFVEYQPVVETKTRRCVGAEALVRWRLGDTVIGPGTFIPLAEESGVIAQITRIVLDTVAHDLPRLLEQCAEFCVAINLSATDLRQLSTIGLLEDLLVKSGALPRNIIIEATEHSFLPESHSQEVIAGIRDRGFQVAIDDFGTGYSSLSRVQNLDLDVLKIDKAFVDTIGTDAATSQVVSHIIDLAHSLKMGMVAEGVETEPQAQFLHDRGVELAQGWLFGKPTSVDELCRRLRKQESMRLAETTPGVLFQHRVSG